VMYSCNTTTGQCAEDPKGTQAPGECIATCKCVVPNNCGQLNCTTLCNAPVSGCNACYQCCLPFNNTQHHCDECVAAEC
jgi:hypothetical protein